MVNVPLNNLIFVAALKIVFDKIVTSIIIYRVLKFSKLIK